MKSRINIFSVLVFGTLNILLGVSILLGAKQVEGSRKPGSSLGAYPAPATSSFTPTKLATTPKIPQPTKQAVTPKIPEPTKPYIPTKAPTPIEPTVSVTPSRTAVVLENGWYLYTDPQVGYSISYPPRTFFGLYRAMANQKYTSVNLQFMIPDIGYQWMAIDIIDNPDNRPIEEVLLEIYNHDSRQFSADTLKQALVPFKVGNVDGFKTTFRWFFEVSVFAPLKGKVVMMSPFTDMGVTAVDPKIMELFYQIVATFDYNSAP